MKKFLFLLFGLVLLVRLPSAVAENLSTCQPYNIVNKDSISACPVGYSGIQYKITTKACPSGSISTSQAFVTTGCIPLTGSGGQPQRPPLNCASDANSSCAKAPNAAGCPDGQHWTLAGSNVAHCVLDDFACPWGNSLKHDRLGNPSCIANTCPGNQVLQGDGIACACPASLAAWTGSTCVVPCVSSTTPNSAVACPAGYSGTMYTSTVVSCPGGPAGASTTSTSGFNTSGCAALPVTCTAGTAQGAGQNCGYGYNGSQFPLYTTTCPAGSYGAPSTSLTGWKTDQCVPAPVTCTASVSSLPGVACGPGYTGIMYQTAATSCPGGPYGSPATSYSGYNTSACGCANGGTNYPACTPPAPPPKQCKEAVRYCYLGEAGQSGDPRDNWYYFGYVYFEGPACEPVLYNLGMNSEDSGGCYQKSSGVNWDEY